MLPALENLENELVAFFPVLAKQRLDVLEGWRLERLEPVPFVHLANDTNHVFAATDVGGQKVARASGGLNVTGRQDLRS